MERDKGRWRDRKKDKGRWRDRQKIYREAERQTEIKRDRQSKKRQTEIKRDRKTGD
jgi:hypothetical protein